MNDSSNTSISLISPSGGGLCFLIGLLSLEIIIISRECFLQFTTIWKVEAFKSSVNLIFPVYAPQFILILFALLIFEFDKSFSESSLPQFCWLTWMKHRNYSNHVQQSSTFDAIYFYEHNKVGYNPFCLQHLLHSLNFGYVT